RGPLVDAQRPPGHGERRPDASNALLHRVLCPSAVRLSRGVPGGCTLGAGGRTGGHTARLALFPGMLLLSRGVCALRIPGGAESGVLSSCGPCGHGFGLVSGRRLGIGRRAGPRGSVGGTAALAAGSAGGGAAGSDDTRRRRAWTGPLRVGRELRRLPS